MSSTATGADRTPGIIQALALLFPITMAVMGSVVLQVDLGLLMKHYEALPRVEYLVALLLTVPAIVATLFTAMGV